MKLYSNYAFNFYTLMCQATANLAGKTVTVELVSEEKKNSKDFKAINMTGKFPLLECPEGHLSESIAICKYLAHEHATLNGASAIEKAKVDQWCQWTISTLIPNNMPIFAGIFGWREIENAQFNDCNKNLKEHVRAINTALTGDYLVGNTITIADVAAAAALSMAFQTNLDAGFRKAAPKVSAWFERVASNPEFVKAFGHIKMCAKPVKPATVKAAPKKEAPKKEVKPKVVAEDEEEAPKKKEINPLDALPPTNFDLFNFKTLMVNHPDKSGAGVDELLKQIDHEGFSMWFLHYDKYKGEGEKLFMTENLMRGFLQRFDHFRKHALARICILGEEPSLDIEGVWLFRGLEIPFEMHDHPQFEYYNHRKMNLKDDKDVQLIREFWGATYEKPTNGRKVQSIAWHK